MVRTLLQEHWDWGNNEIHEKIYYKKYPAKKYRPMRDALNRVPSDFYKTEEFEELKL